MKFESKKSERKRDVSEKNQQELGNFKISEKGEILYRKFREKSEIQTVDDYIDFLDKKIKDIIASEEKKIPASMLGYIEYPGDFEKVFESRTKERSEAEVLAMIDRSMRDLSSAYESANRIYDLVLDQRLSYKDIDDSEKNNEIKKQLDERIHHAQIYQRNILELQDFLERKKIEYILKAEQNGTLSRDDIGDEDE